MSKQVLVTGGQGYIGSHCLIELIKQGYEPIVADNSANSCAESIKRVEKITGKSIPNIHLDVLDYAALDKLFKEQKFFAVLHLAALKAVGESMEKPLEYFQVNVTGTINVLNCMRANNVKNFIFSSSATVYGTPQYLPLDEKHSRDGDQVTNPYGKSKFIVEHILMDLARSDKDWNICILRYFNPVGAHESGLIGEDPQGPPANLMPFVSQVAVGRRPEVNVFGTDYDTVDGTGVRDYIHIYDLAVGHVMALKKIEEGLGLKIYNLGTGNGTSVMEMIAAMEKASGKKIPFKNCPRRAGDIASCYAEPTLAFQEMGWKATKNVEDMCKDLWNWQQKNPMGFQSAEKE